MSVSGSVGQLREAFGAQFEERSDGRFLYRRNQKGEPIPVSAEERERFVRQYMRRISLILVGMIAALLAFAGLIIWRTPATDGELSNITIYVGFVGIAAVAIGLMYWVRGAPGRALTGRTPVGRERTKAEMRATFFRRTNYAQLASAAAIGVFIVASRATEEDVFSGWHRLWLVLGAGLILLAAVQAFRKWRFDSEHPDDLVS